MTTFAAGNKNRMSSYRANIAKEEIPSLPQEFFPGTIRVLDGDAIPSDVAEKLESARLVGFDTESRPSFTRGVHYKVSLVQLALADECFLVRLRQHRLPDLLRRLFNRSDIIKVGLSSQDDFRQMRALCPGLRPANVVELQELAPRYGIEDKSLQKIYAIVFGRRICKSQQLTNWEAATLTPAQQQYAALDAWACRQLYLKLTESAPDRP